MEDSILDIKINQIKTSLLMDGDVILQIKGLSMWPLLHDGQMVMIKAVPFDKIFIGDIILTYADKCVLCHRVLRKGDDFIQTKADALIGIDAKVASDHIIGKVAIKYKNDKAVNLETPMQKVFAYLYVHLTFILSPIYPFLGIMRRAVKRPTTIK